MINDNYKKLLGDTFFVDIGNNKTPMSEIGVEVIEYDRSCCRRSVIAMLRSKISYLARLSDQTQRNISNIESDISQDNMSNKVQSLDSFVRSNYNIDEDSSKFFVGVSLSISGKLSKLKNLKQELVIIKYKLKSYKNMLSDYESNIDVYDEVLKDLEDIE